MAGYHPDIVRSLATITREVIDMAKEIRSNMKPKKIRELQIENKASKKKKQGVK